MKDDSSCSRIQPRFTAALLTAFLSLSLFAPVAVRDAGADVRLPAVFSPNMVLQRDAELPVWGWAEAGEKVGVSIGDNRAIATADKGGKWMVRLKPMAAGGPHKLVVEAANRIELGGVLIGEVWIGSGQSNMAMSVSRSKDYENEKRAADFPLIRMFSVSRASATSPQGDCQGEWKICSPETVGGFSATAFFFGRELHNNLGGVPVGLINTSWGGTAVEAWTSMSAQMYLKGFDQVMAPWKTQIDGYDPVKAKARHEDALKKWTARAASAKAQKKRAPRKPQLQGDPRKNQNHPANLFNGMVNPLIPYAIRGAVWYQGERNSGQTFAQLYDEQLGALIADWRRRWGQGNFPFAWVQLPNYMEQQTEPVEDRGWVVVRDSMQRALSVPNTGMAITTDIGEAKDIHPKNKQDVGRRLGWWALAEVYGKDVASSGPLFRSFSIADGEVAVSFEHAYGGLKAKGGEVKGFAIAGADKKWRFAKARIEGDSVVLSHPEVKAPEAVRYNWAANPIGNLFNGADIPAAQFRTDDWKLNVTGR